MQSPYDINDHDGPENGSESGSGTKRKRHKDDSSRSKRTRYISIACNECKRRKIKCNGDTPCHRCGSLKLGCVYEPNCCNGNLKHSSDFKRLTAHVTHLESRIQDILSNVNHLRSALGHGEFAESALIPQTPQPHYNQSSSTLQTTMTIDPALHSHITRPSAQTIRFHGPTSPAFSLGVVQHSLNNVNATNAEEANEVGSLISSAPPIDMTETRRGLHSSKDPIWGIAKDEAVRLCRVFEDENGLMYPILDIDSVIVHANLLYQFMDAAQRAFLVTAFPGADVLQDEDTDILKLVLAIALVTESSGQSDLGRRLFEQVNKSGDRRLLGSVNLKDIQILTLSAIYHFHTDDEGLAWRVIGVTARLCLELGLHRSETYFEKFDDEQERSAAMKLFWSVYVLDHRWSMGTGMSFALQDADIDKTLPTPEDTSPYLATMIQYSRIGSRVWKTVSSSDTSIASTSGLSKDDAEFLDYQVIQWYQNVPKHLRFMHPESAGHTPDAAANFNRDGGRPLYQLRVLLYLRQNQMRITIYRPYLHSRTSITAHPAAAQIAVDVAKDIVRILRHIDQSSELYRRQQTTWNHFLLSALAALALAVCHAPMRFSSSCREEFLMALDMIRGLSTNSYVSKRLWRTVRNLRELGVRLGSQHNDGRPMSGSALQTSDSTDDFNMLERRQPQHEAQRSAAMVMAGLATGVPVDGSAFPIRYPQNVNNGNAQSVRNNRTDQPMASLEGMATEMTNLFEAAGIWNEQWSTTNELLDNVGSSAPRDVHNEAVCVGDDGRGSASDQEELGRIFQTLF